MKSQDSRMQTSGKICSTKIIFRSEISTYEADTNQSPIIQTHKGKKNLFKIVTV